MSPLHTFLALVSETVKEETFRRIYLKTLAVSCDENYQTWDGMSGNEVNVDKYFMVSRQLSPKFTRKLNLEK